MFQKEVYVRRRQTLLKKMRDAGESGIVLFIGNAEAPAQYKDNCYKWRQDSSWLYFFGLDKPLYAAILDIDSGAETIFADDVDIDDIIWMGPQPTVASLAASVGVSGTAPYGALSNALSVVHKAGRKLHYLPLHVTTTRLSSWSSHTAPALSAMFPGRSRRPSSPCVL